VTRRLTRAEAVRKESSATQFAGSSTVSVPTGGRKKKLNASVASTEASAPAPQPAQVAIASTASR
jgi:hypothetical protein